MEPLHTRGSLVSVIAEWERRTLGMVSRAWRMILGGEEQDRGSTKGGSARQVERGRRQLVPPGKEESGTLRANLEDPQSWCERPSRNLQVSARDPRGTSRTLRKTLEGRRGQCERPSRDLEDAAKNPRGSSRSVRETFEARRGQCERPSRVVEGFASRPRGPLRVREGVEELKCHVAHTQT